ncbi:MAG: hypothetical protein K2R98_25790 [Gemmataceae bacterium]|nr:hypothetical protein [Gemmataceae bacterium]
MAGDVVVSQHRRELAYGFKSNVNLTTSRNRFQDTTATRALGDPSSTTPVKAHGLVRATRGRNGKILANPRAPRGHFCVSCIAKIAFRIRLLLSYG